MATKPTPAVPMAVLSVHGHNYLMTAEQATAVAAVLLPILSLSERVERDWNVTGNAVQWRPAPMSSTSAIELTPVSATHLAELRLKANAD